MDTDESRELLRAERERVERLIAEQTGAVDEDREAALDEAEGGEIADTAEPLTTGMVDRAIDGGLRERLAAIERAEQRLAEGTYGRSVLSGDSIPDERLRADPAAELTVEEAERAQAER